ncbi:hypothetical protein MAHJHV58_09190 [Mycobacterium avium subsp. hominissuis]
MTAPVFQIHPTVFHPHHRADVAGFHVLDHQPRLGGMLGRAGLAPTRRKDIRSIAIHHAAILGSVAAKHRYGAPPCANRDRDRRR